MAGCVDPNSPEGWLQRMQEQYGERLDAAEIALNKAKQNVADNEAARRAWQQKLKAEEDARKAEADAKFDAEVEPIRIRRCREWLVGQPDKTEANFMKRAWPHIRQTLLEDQRERMYQMARGGKYQM
jgi:hypothetical protein